MKIKICDLCCRPIDDDDLDTMYYKIKVRRIRWRKNTSWSYSQQSIKVDLCSRCADRIVKEVLEEESD